MGTLDKMPAAVEAAERSSRPTSAATTPKKQNPSAPSPAPGDYANGEMGTKPSARNVPLGASSPAAVVIGGENVRRPRPSSSRVATDEDFIRDDDSPGPKIDSPDDDFYTPKSPLTNRQPRRSQSADVYKRRAHRHPSGLPSGSGGASPRGSLTPHLPSLMRSRSRDPDAMSVASSMGRSMSSTQVSSWKDDERIQEWYQRRKEKEREMAKMKIRRAHKDLNWVLERRTAQIANFRRDRKNEEKAEKEVQVKAHTSAAKAHLKASVTTTAKLKSIANHAAGLAALVKGKQQENKEAEGQEGESGNDALPSVKATPPTVKAFTPNDRGGKPKTVHQEESVWLGPGRFVTMTVDNTKRVLDSYDDVQYSTGSGSNSTVPAS